MKMHVKELTRNEIIITKSKFITFLMPVNSLDETKNIIKEYNDLYKDATHVCYGYILDENTFKYYDDGEPSSTAGAPIYQVLKNNDLVYTMCIVVRYFGGTKLGVGGLVKAYTNSALECLNKAHLVKYEQLFSYSIKCDYSIYEKLEYYLRNNGITIVNKIFDEDVTLIVSINKKDLDLLQDHFQNAININSL